MVSMRMSTPGVSTPGLAFGTPKSASGDAAGLAGLTRCAQGLVSVASAVALLEPSKLSSMNRPKLLDTSTSPRPIAWPISCVRMVWNRVRFQIALGLLFILISAPLIAKPG